MSERAPVHPGHVLRDEILAPLGLDVTEAAVRLGVSSMGLSRVIHGRAAISPSLALRLERAGARTAEEWLAMQGAYDVARQASWALAGVRRLDGRDGDVEQRVRRRHLPQGVRDTAEEVC